LQARANVNLTQKINSKTAKIGVIGLGYVGLPLVIEFCKAGFSVTGFDIDDKKVALIRQGKSYIKHIDASRIVPFIRSGKGTSPLLSATTDFSRLADMDCVLVCVPTPLNKNREPDMTYVFNTTKTIALYLRKGQLIVLESTTYPGTTDEDMRSMLEESGLKAGVDFFLAFSPEREDPNNSQYTTAEIPKVVGGYTKPCLTAATALYGQIMQRVVPVSSTKVAEASKLLENIYRSVNIALVNELKMLFDRMDIDIWEVIEAAKTKPFGFQAFYPGPGLGGHCIPIDPFYLTWKAKEYDFATRFIELAGEINTNMPNYVVQKLMTTLNEKRRCLKGSRILILGVAYKPNVDDDRESPAFVIMELIEEAGATVDYSDPYIPKLKKTRKYSFEKTSVKLTPGSLKKYDAVLIVTNHASVDYKLVEKHARLVIDTRNALNKTGIRNGNVYKA
jgi:UDP-N-acetyl-D-glucosamine dehydrogenase